MQWSFGYKVMMVAVTVFPVLVFGIILAYVHFNGSDSNENHYMDGLELSQMGYFKEAIANFDEAIDEDPESVMAYTGRGDAHYAMGDLDRALLDYSQSIILRAVLVTETAKAEYKDLKHAVATAYAGRALIHTSIGNDLEAQRDKAMAVEMGFDAARAQASIDELKSQRLP